MTELKVGDFKPADTAQVELYLRWLDWHERKVAEERGATNRRDLLRGDKKETVEYLGLNRTGIHVAEYLTEH